MKSRILLVDDEKSICEVISLQLKEEGYDVTVAYDGTEALEKVPTFLPDVIVSDIAMPNMNGIELCRQIKDSEKTRFIPFIIMTSLMDRAKRLEALEAGCDEFLNKPIDTVEMFTRLKALIRVKKLIDQLEDSKNIIRMLANAIEAKDGYTGKHTERVAGYSLALAKKCGVSRDLWITIELGALLHDVGKIGIPEMVLGKTSRLDANEFKIIQQHPDIGVEICRPIKFLSNVLKVIRHHHERIDGRGYPEGLKGEEIPIEARIVSIADAFDAITTDRPYQKGVSQDKAIELLKKGQGTQWDSELIDHFVELVQSDSS